MLLFDTKWWKQSGSPGSRLRVSLRALVRNSHRRPRGSITGRLPLGHHVSSKCLLNLGRERRPRSDKNSLGGDHLSNGAVPDHNSTGGLAVDRCETAAWNRSLVVDRDAQAPDSGDQGKSGEREDGGEMRRRQEGYRLLGWKWGGWQKWGGWEDLKFV